MTSVLHAPAPPATKSNRRIEFFVFSDDSFTSPPHVGENRHGEFAVPFPSSPDDDYSPEYKIAYQRDMADAVDYKIIQSGSQYFLKCTVQSGTRPDRGYYHSVVDFAWRSAGEHLYAGVWRAGSDAHYLWAGVDWNNFQAKWNELSNQNLRLTKLKTYVETVRASTPVSGELALTRIICGLKSTGTISRQNGKT
jgi:hypothetical protein